jgi:redox-sensitive bicupin YhaK (pirin superfamily)
LQIWIFPERNGLTPSYEQKDFPEPERRGKLRLIASPDGRDGSVTIHQDVRLSTALLKKGDEASLPLAQGRSAWVQVARGSVDVNGRRLGPGDGAAVTREERLELSNGDGAEVLVFDLR